MALEKTTSVDLVEVAENGCVQVRIKTSVLENGAPLGGSFHRHVVAPGDDYSKEDDFVKAICKATHTPAVIAAYKASLTAA